MALSVVGATAVSPASVWTVCGWCVWAAEGGAVTHVGAGFWAVARPANWALGFFFN